MNLHPEKIPAELRALPRWVNWKLVKRDGKLTKIPVNPHTGRNAAADDPATWASFEDARKRLGIDPELAGLGFMFNGDGIAGVDLDHVLNDAGTITPEAAEIVRALNTYTEASQSGTGLHMLCRATLPEGRGRRKGSVELYCRGRFFVVTGDQWPDTPATIEPRQEQIDALLAQLFPPKEKTAQKAAAPAELSDAELIERASAATNGAKFSALWRGDWATAGHTSQSEADAALLGMLRFWTGGDKARSFRLFSQSDLTREKWDREDYRESTWAAIDSGEVYSPTTGAAYCGKEAPGDSAPMVAARAGNPFAMTDLGNAERFAAYHGEAVRWDTARVAWRAWDRKRWATDGGLNVNRLAAEAVRMIRHEAAVCPKPRADVTPDKAAGLALFKHALRSESRDRLAALLEVAKAQPGIAVAANRWDVDPWLLNVANGTIDLRTGELRPHDRRDLLTKLAPVEYRPGLRDERWERFLQDATGGDAELIGFLQVVSGYTLTGDTSEEILLLVYGPEASGKTTFLEALRGVMGDYARTIQADLLAKRRDPHGAGNASPELAALAGARLAAGSEMEQGREIAEALAKNLTGGEPITARHLYAESFDFRPQFKLWLALNHCPKVSADDGAIWRRILRIGFEHTVPAERRDKTLKPYLRDPNGGAPAVLAWAVEGCLRWQREGLNVPAAVARSTEAYRAESDPLAPFFEDCLLFNEAALIPSGDAWTAWGDIWGAYCAHADENGTAERYRVAPKRLQDRLKARGCACERRHAGRGWLGVAVREGWAGA